MPVDGSTLRTSDTWLFAWSRPDGTLINQRAARSENGEVAMNLALDPREDGGWSVSGKLRGKDVDYAIDEDAPVSELGQLLAVRALLGDAGTDTASLPMWVPTADPSQLLNAEVTIDPRGRNEGFGQLNVGPIAILAQFESNGSLRYGTMEAGPAKITLERIWTRGELF